MNAQQTQRKELNENLRKYYIVEMDGHLHILVSSATNKFKYVAQACLGENIKLIHFICNGQNDLPDLYALKCDNHQDYVFATKEICRLDIVKALKGLELNIAHSRRKKIFDEALLLYLISHQESAEIPLSLGWNLKMDGSHFEFQMDPDQTYYGILEKAQHGGKRR